MYTFEEFMIAVYYEVDDALKVLTSGQSLRGRGFVPGLSDAEVEYQGIDADNFFKRFFGTSGVWPSSDCRLTLKQGTI